MLISLTPELLIDKSNELEKIVGGLGRQINEMENIVSASNKYWIGDAGDALRKDYSRLCQEMRDVHQFFKDYPLKLLSIAGVSRMHDNKAIQMADALPGNVLD